MLADDMAWKYLVGLYRLRPEILSGTPSRRSPSIDNPGARPEIDSIGSHAEFLKN
jgi:hypothetical protein